LAGHQLGGKVPPGMNGFDQPVEMIEIDETIAMIHTPNNCGDIMRLAFKPGALKPDFMVVRGNVNITPQARWDLRDSYYRNFTPKSAEKSYPLALNMVAHLLIGFNEMLTMSGA
jgi:hypothetical protein